MKKIISILLTLIMFATIAYVAPKNSLALAEKENAQVKTEVLNPTEYAIGNNYSYRLEKALPYSPDSFEAWVKLPVNSMGGTIMGNYYNTLYTKYTGTVNWEVDNLGQLVLYWNNKTVSKTFSGVYLNTGNWEHVALVRNKQNSTFTLYLNGVQRKIVDLAVGESVDEMKMSIGVDYGNWTSYKNPLQGEIKQITIYNGAISQEKVKQDMQNTAISTQEDGTTLMGNWYFGEKWNKRVVLDTSSYKNNANLSTYEKYVGVDQNFGNYDYTIVGIPDIQTTVRYKYDRSQAMAQWIANNKTSNNIKFAIQVGDLADDGSASNKYYSGGSMKYAYNYYSDGRKIKTDVGLWEGAVKFVDTIQNAGVPISFVQGNHDYDDNCKGTSTTRQSSNYNGYFPYSKYSTLSYFGGAYEVGSMENYYVLYNFNGVKYLVLNLEFGPRRDVIRWASRVCETYPDHRVIINTHAFVDPDGEIMDSNARYSAHAYGFSKYTEVSAATDVFDGICRKNPNVFMVLSGHNGCDDIVWRTDYGDYGNKVTSILLDSQVARYTRDYASLGEDDLMLMKFNEAEKTIHFNWYSPYYDACFGIQNQFKISFADANNPAIGL